MLAKKLSGATAAAGAYKIERSLRFNPSDSANLSRTFSTNGTNRKIRTISFWVKRSRLSEDVIFQCYDNSSTCSSGFWFETGGTLKIGHGDCNYLITSQVFRDSSAWYHIVIAYDTTQATASNRAKLYVNGTQVTAFGTEQYPTQNLDTQFCYANSQNRIGSYWNDTQYFGGYFAEFYFIDGQALTPSSFGETNADTGVWQPKAYTGTYGTNGFYLNFSDNSGTTSTTLGKDTSGNSNNWTPNNFSVTAGSGNDSLVDTPTPYGTDTGAGGEVRGNYCTLNPLAQGGSMQAPTNGNLNISTTGSAYGQTLGTIAMPSGKWYWEVTPTTLDAVGIMAVGITLCTTDLSTYAGYESYSYVYLTDGRKANNNSFVSYGASVAVNDVIGIAFDADAGTITFYKNGVSQGTAYSSIPSNNYLPTIGDEGLSNNLAGIFNFGQRPFAYTAPSGFKALCTQNLPAPTVVQGDTAFNTIIWTGNGSSPRSFTGVGFQPDFTWIKMRSDAYQHVIADSVRGGNKILHSNSTAAEDVNWQYGYLSSFDADGFTAVAGSTSIENINLNSATFVAWNWKGGGSGVSNTDGSITSTVSVNTTAGISIATFTVPSSGTYTVGHGLGVAPSVVIFKDRSNSSTGWGTFHSAVCTTTSDYLSLSSTAALGSASGIFGSALPNSSVWGSTAGTGINGNASGVAYCFAPVAGFSAFGKYTGNGSTDGPFVYTGFRPAFVLTKAISSGTTGNWRMTDNARNTYNVANYSLFPNLTNAESTNNIIDMLSNGFKMRETNTDRNGSGTVYIYMAFAENPFKHSLAR